MKTVGLASQRTIFSNLMTALLATAFAVNNPPYIELVGDIEFVREEHAGYSVKLWNSDRSNYGWLAYGQV